MPLTCFAIGWFILGLVLAALAWLDKIPFIVFIFYWGLSSIFYFLTINKTKKGND